MRRNKVLTFVVVFLVFLTSNLCFANSGKCKTEEAFARNSAKCLLSMENLLSVFNKRSGILIYGVENYSEFMMAINILSIFKEKPFLVETIPSISTITIQVTDHVNRSAIYGGNLDIYITTQTSIRDLKQFLDKEIYDLGKVTDEEWFDMMAEVMDEVEKQRKTHSTDEGNSHTDSQTVIENILR